MDAHEHFGFSKPPFESTPHTDFFFDAPTHAEALATLQYTISTRKRCCVVIGESGYGKTLLARLAAASVNAAAAVLWVHGCGRPDNATRVTVYPPGQLDRPDGIAAAEEKTLGVDAYAAQLRPNAPVLVVDSADELPAHGWRDVIAWLSNETRSPKPVSVLLFGLPRLLERLAAPELERLEWRIFRVCRLEPLSPQLTKEYIRARVAAAGGDARRVFSDAAVARIGKAGHGNPALINQLCDNALLEAYSEERDCVTMADVGNALHAILGGRLTERAALPAPPSTRPALPPVQVPAPPCWNAQALDAPRIGARLADSLWEARASSDDRRVAVAPLSGTLPAQAEGPIETRLKDLEARLSQALRAVRVARDRHTGARRDMTTVSDRPSTITREDRLVARPVEAEAKNTVMQPAGMQPTA